ncbi:MAG TPA: MATE family efflux transporter, partial [Thiolinea sp.]|nr:MATE family efflux transporter [Thiolinea sp.]
ALCVGVVAILVSLGLAHSLHWFGVEPSIIPEAQRYIYWVTWSLPFIFLALVPRAFNEAKRNTLPMMWIQLLLMPLNIVGNYLFMFGHVGFPAMGAAGAALSTGISQVVGCILLFTYTLKTPRYRSYDLAKRMTRPDPAHMMQLLRLGIPISVSLGMEVGMFMVVALLMGSFGVTAAAGHQIALNVASLTFMVPLGTAMALTVQVGNAIGAQAYELARQRGQLGIALCAGFMLLSGVNLWLWGEQIASWYSTDLAVVQAASHFLLFAALFQLGDGIQVSSAGALRGYKDTLYPMLITTFCYWVVGVALGWYLSQYTTLGASGLWLGLVTGLFMAALLLGLRFNSLSKRLLNTVRD